VSKCATQEGLRDLEVAYQNFFGRVKRGAKAKGFPKSKSHTGRCRLQPEKGSNNRRKAIVKLARAHACEANIRSNALHQITSELAKTKPFIAIEDLNVAGKMRNHSLAQAINDVGFSEFRR
jgi:transposase